MNLRIKLNRGSVLVFSLMVLAVMLSAALTIATVSVTNRQSVGVSSESTQSFQVANSGVELASQKIYKGNDATLNDLAGSMGAACNANQITKNNFSGGTVVMTFFDNNGTVLACNDNNWRSKVVRMKSEGTASGTTRVVETAIAAGNFNYEQKTCALVSVGANMYECTATCSANYKVVGGGYTFGAAYTFGINAYPSSTDAFTCAFAKDASQGNNGCSSGSGACGSACYAICIQ